ncbi:phage replication protein O [Pseudomonas sp. BAY1663]|uniref:replication protein n=1 Tax=Pseudomonas sp. BAY1663 TaxID=1439940 RepID=UPI00042DE709|nr:replication protein [Pseudomonas sp. BAY1663]EXF45244.1 phage replication protein O [Pseudomonas sp. BAY1663]
MNNVIQIGNTKRGFTRMDNSIMDALMAIDLPARELKVALFVAKTTINFQAGPVRITAAAVSKATHIHPDVASKAISHLLKRRVIFREGGARGDIGLCDPKEWVFVEGPNQTNRADSDQNDKVISIASQTKSDDSLLYSKKEPLVTVPSEQITAPQGGEPTQVEKDSGVSFNGEDFQVSSDLITKWAKATHRLTSRLRSFAPRPGLPPIARRRTTAASWSTGLPRPMSRSPTACPRLACR